METMTAMITAPIADDGGVDSGNDSGNSGENRTMENGGRIRQKIL